MLKRMQNKPYEKNQTIGKSNVHKKQMKNETYFLEQQEEMNWYYSDYSQLHYCLYFAQKQKQMYYQEPYHLNIETENKIIRIGEQIVKTEKRIDDRKKKKQINRE